MSIYYLSDRSCRVNVNGSISNIKQLLYGVPQGSVIGPQAFTYYTRIVGNIIEHHSLSYHVYADDVQIYLRFNPSADGEAVCALYRLAKCVDDLQSWMLSNRLKLNQSKTEFFIASSRHHYESLKHHTLILGDQEISNSPSIRNLGVTFDSSMTMCDHITALSRSIHWQLYNLNRIRKHLDTDTCHNIVRTLILSKLDYCNSLMYGIDKKQLHRLQVLQNRCARLILRQPSRTHASPLLHSLHWLPIARRIEFKLLIITFKAFHLNSPQYLSSYFQLYKTTYALRFHKHHGDRALSVAGPSLWNELPCNIRGLDQISVFKSHLKSYLYPDL